MPNRRSPARADTDASAELTARERAVVARLLSRAFPGVEMLREQLPHLRATARAGCCASVGLSVIGPEGHRPPRLPGCDTLLERPLPVAGRWRAPGRGEMVEALLFERAGWLSHLEVLHDDGAARVELPDPSTIELVDAF